MGYSFGLIPNERNKVYHDGEWGVPVHDHRKKNQQIKEIDERDFP